MLLNKDQRQELDVFFHSIRLNYSSDDKTRKIEQILAYLEIIQSQIRKLSYKRKLIFVDCGAGNCYLSFLVNYYYSFIDKRDVSIHCIDTNKRLMGNCKIKAQGLGFDNMRFHSCSILDFNIDDSIDMVYSLHACDIATDQTLHLGLRLEARDILSVSCCQHTVKKELHSHPYTGITKHRVFKDRLVYMIADSLRALLLESNGYKADIIEFVSSHYTEKNVMIRAKKSKNRDQVKIIGDYEKISQDFNVKPKLEKYLNNIVA